MNRVRWAAIIGFATTIVGLAAALLPPVAALEESLGLPALFLSRGDIRPPDGVVLVSLDEAASARLGLPASVRDWPRSAYATLVDRLVARGVAAIGFDVQFFRHGDPAADQAFAESIARSRRVVLIQRLEVARTGAGEMWERQDPIPLLASEALALAPVPMPDVPVVTWTWAFLRTPAAGEVPTLSAVMLQVKAMSITAEFIDIATEAGVSGLEGLPRSAAEIRQHADLLRLMQTLRQQIQLRPSAVAEAVAKRVGPGSATRAAGDARLLQALGDLYSTPNVHHLNFYGPPGHICTIPYNVAVSDTLRPNCELNGAVVFVGQASGRVDRAGQADTYHTAYSGPESIDFSGVEIHATAMSNLLTREDLHPATGGLLAAALASIGFALGAVVYWVRTRRRQSKRVSRSRWEAAVAAGVLMIAYGAVAYLVFQRVNMVLPILVPIAVQLPIALGLGLLAPAARHRQEVQAVCLATDAGGSTAVGQRLPHNQYAQLMDDYRRSLVSAVRAHGGEPIPPEGDGLVCVWYGSPGRDAAPVDRGLRLRACRAALEIADAAARFNLEQKPEQQLPTRVGLTVGTVTIHSDADRGVFEIVGDTVNVAARLRDLNRDLGTHVIASEEVTEGFDTMLTLRHVPGTFTLKGVSRTPNVVEIVSAADAAGR